MTKMSDTPQDRSADGVPEVEQMRTPTFGETVYFEHGGRVVSGVVRSTRTGGGFNEIVAFSIDLGHTHRIDDGVRVQVADLLPEPRTESDIVSEVAALREKIVASTVGGHLTYVKPSEIMACLDRIAALVPQRATDGDGWGMWLHACGYPQSARRGDGICDGCGGGMAEGWRALYTAAER